MTLGQRPLSWKFVRKYVLTLQALLRGQAVEWEGALIQMMQPAGYGAPRPITVPIILGIGGPKGIAAANDIADGVFATSPVPGFAANGKHCVLLAFGTVLDEGEDPGSPRAMAAAGHGAAVALHALYERGGDFARIPGGAEWVAELERVPEDRRHITLHDLHLIGLNERDAKVMTGAMVRQFGGARTADEWCERLAQLEAAGVTEIAYQPAGPDIPGELERFARASGLRS